MHPENLSFYEFMYIHTYIHTTPAVEGASITEGGGGRCVWCWRARKALTSAIASAAFVCCRGHIYIASVKHQ